MSWLVLKKLYIWIEPSIFLILKHITSCNPVFSVLWYLLQTGSNSTIPWGSGLWIARWGLYGYFGVSKHIKGVTYTFVFSVGGNFELWKVSKMSYLTATSHKLPMWFGCDIYQKTKSLWMENKDGLSNPVTKHSSLTFSAPCHAVMPLRDNWSVKVFNRKSKKRTN